MEGRLGVVYRLALTSCQVVSRDLCLIKVDSTGLRPICIALLNLYLPLSLVFLVKQVLVCIEKVGDVDAAA